MMKKKKKKRKTEPYRFSKDLLNAVEEEALCLPRPITLKTGEVDPEDVFLVSCP